ncbi:hydrolase [Lactobacillus psittaci]|nr:hydrolase [Lactobacillus psittaci]
MIEVNQANAASSAVNYNKISTTLVKDTIKPSLMHKKFVEAKHQEAINTLTKNAKAEQARMDEAAKKEAEAKKQAEEKQKAASQAPAGQSQTSQVQTSQTTINKGTFKLSFYDPAVLGSNMGYGGVAANLSVFPKGTRLKITLSDGTVWYRVVNDTGSFAASNPNQLDVAMPNSQVPAAGILYATVEVIQ